MTKSARVSVDFGGFTNTHFCVIVNLPREEGDPHRPLEDSIFMTTAESTRDRVSDKGAAASVSKAN